MNAKSSSLNKVTTLNPNAEEFIPSGIKFTNGSAKSSATIKLDAPGSTEEAGLGRSESNISNTSDDEAQRYWKNQLPDDITPDFKVMALEEIQGPEHLELEALSFHDVTEPSILSASVTNQILGPKQDFTAEGSNFIFSGKMGYNVSGHAEEQSSRSFINAAVGSWGKQLVDGKQQSSIVKEDYIFNRDHSPCLVNDIVGDNGILQNAAFNPLDFLSSQFPEFSLQSLADVYYRNGCDLNATIETLIQLELQLGGFSQNHNSKSHPSLNMLNFPMPVADAHNNSSNYGDAQHASNGNRYLSSSFVDAIDFASEVKRLASKDTSSWRYNPGNGAGVGSSRNSEVLASLHNGHGKVIYIDKLQAQVELLCLLQSGLRLERQWVAGSICSEPREERDYARLWNACFEQAKQAYLIGNKSLARELSLKGQWYSLQMKAHEKARETIYRPRHTLSADFHELDRGHEPLLNLLGLHVSEAIHVLIRELSIMKKTAISTGQLQRVMIYVGAGHHVKGARSPATRLPIAVEQYLLEEGLHYTQPQPGLFHVVIY